MTASRVKSTGSGGLRFVVCIEGIRFRFVSDANDVSYTLADTQGTWSVHGLKTDGWVFTERVDLIQAKLDAEPITVTISDIKGLATMCFDTAPSGSYLDGDLTDTSETVSVFETSAWPSTPALVYIGTETMLCDGSTATTLGSPGNTTRAYHRSYATYHYNFSGASPDAGLTPVTNGPIHFEGRRVEFFAYDAGETIDIRTTTGAGNDPFWIGIISTEPKFDGASWSFTVDPLTSRFKQKIGANLGDPLSIRGIYYPASAPLMMGIEESGSTLQYSSAAYTEFAMCGFWETQQEFIDALNAQIAAQMAAPLSGAFTQSLQARVTPDGGWGFIVQTTGASPHYLIVYGLGPGGALSAVDGVPQPWLILGTYGAVNSVVASQIYEIPIDPQPGLTGHGTVPRAYYGHSRLGAEAILRMPADARRVDVNEMTFPNNRLYLSGQSALITAGTQAQLSWEANGIGLLLDTDTPQTVTATNASLRYIETQLVIRGDPPGDPHGLVATSANSPEIRMGISLGEGTLATMLTTLTTLAPQYAPLGAVPMLRTGEISPGDIDEAASVSRLAQRKWILFQEADLEEMIQQELRLLGCHPAIGGSGQITFKRIRFGAPGEPPAASLTQADFLHENAKFYSYERAPYGLVNLWTLHTGYNAREDDYSGPIVNVVDYESRSNSARTREMNIKPFSVERYTFDPGELIVEAQKLAANVLGVFGGPYKVFTCRVPLTRLIVEGGTSALTNGSIVSITWSKPPNGDGTKGLTAKIGVIVSRAVHMRSAYIELTILLTDQRVAGYSPSAKTTLVSGGTGGTGPHVVTMSSTYMPVGTDVSDFWMANDKIRVFKWNDATPGTVTGTVTSVTAATNQITFSTDAAWTHGGVEWVLGSQVSTSVSSSKQKQYAYIATATAKADFADVDISPYTFA